MKLDFKIIDKPVISNVKGFKSAGIYSGIRKNINKPDLGIVVCEEQAQTFACFTTNKVKAAPLIVCKEHLKDKKARAVIVNSGNANACTGERGLHDAYETTQEFASQFKMDAKDILPLSTGVIGEHLPINNIKKGISVLKEVIDKGSSHDFPEAILTTDTVTKTVGVQFTINGIVCNITGVAKGSGMIHPNMATMLGFVFTDVDISDKLMEKLLKKEVESSFNSITVDGDTSTNDTVLVMNSKISKNKKINNKGKNYEIFANAFSYVLKELAKKIVFDGEGATKYIEISVNNACSHKDAKQAAKSVATSNLVKTAFFGEDCNWGRIICALGYSGIQFNPEKIKIYIGDMLLFKNGEKVDYIEQEAQKILQKKEIKVTIDLCQKNKNWTVWTTDLSYDYVKINASYRT